MSDYEHDNDGSEGASDDQDWFVSEGAESAVSGTQEGETDPETAVSKAITASRLEGRPALITTEEVDNAGYGDAHERLEEAGVTIVPADVIGLPDDPAASRPFWREAVGYPSVEAIEEATIEAVPSDLSSFHRPNNRFIAVARVSRTATAPTWKFAKLLATTLADELDPDETSDYDLVTLWGADRDAEYEDYPSLSIAVRAKNQFEIEHGVNIAAGVSGKGMSEIDLSLLSGRMEDPKQEGTYQIVDVGGLDTVATQYLCRNAARIFLLMCDEEWEMLDSSSLVSAARNWASLSNDISRGGSGIDASRTTLVAPNEAYNAVFQNIPSLWEMPPVGDMNYKRAAETWDAVPSDRRWMRELCARVFSGIKFAVEADPPTDGFMDKLRRKLTRKKTKSSK